MDHLLYPIQYGDRIYLRLPGYPYPLFRAQIKIISPIPTIEKSLGNSNLILNFKFGFKESYETNIIQLREAFDIFLSVRPIKASDIPCKDIIHWVYPQCQVLSGFLPSPHLPAVLRTHLKLWLY